MGLAEAKNDIKTIFLLLNSICGLIAGAYSVANGVSYAVFGTSVVTVGLNFVVGLLLLGLAVLGYVGAILDHRIILIVYAVALSLFVTVDILALGAWFTDVSSNFRHSSEWVVIVGIQFVNLALCHAVISLVSVSLAAMLASQARRRVNPSNQGHVLSPPLPTGPLLSA